MSAHLARVLFACISKHTSQPHSRSSPCNSLENAKPRAHRCTPRWSRVLGCSLFGSNLTLHAVATLCIYVRVVELSEMERVHTFVCLTFSPSSSGHGSSQSSWRADLFSRWSGRHTAFKARGTVSALYTETRKLCSCPQIGVCVSLGPVSDFARVSDSN